MNYFRSLNPVIIEYFNILSSNDTPGFLYKYIDTEDMQRLSKIGFFCGCDYTKLHNINVWYSRLDHSIACALMAWNFTKDKTQTIISLFHDLGTPAFSHCINYLLNDHQNQESSEKNIKDIIKKSKTIVKYLKEDNININDIDKIKNYTIIENKTPKICTDRIESIFSSGLFWQQYWELKDIEKIYKDLTISINEENEEELSFKSLEIAEIFFEGSIKNSLALQSNEDKYTMQFIADNIKVLMEKNKLTFNDLYIKSEKEIIETIKKDIDLKENWDIFTHTKEITRTEEKPNQYYVSVNAKKRYVNPLIENKKRLNELSIKSNNLLDKYLNYKDSAYCYVENIKKIK